MTLLMTLLIIALVIAIIFDAIRIMQYISFRKTIDKVNEELGIRRVNSAYRQYQEDNPPISFGEYLNDWMKSYRNKKALEG